jgi:hypothetical protein
MDKGIDRSFSGIQMDLPGILEVRFKSWVQNAKVCAIEVTPQK